MILFKFSLLIFACSLWCTHVTVGFRTLIIGHKETETVPGIPKYFRLPDEQLTVTHLSSLTKHNSGNNIDTKHSCKIKKLCIVTDTFTHILWHNYLNGCNWCI